MAPLVSVVMPVYNGEAFVADAVRSALEQSHPNKEVIVVDDGSTDGTLQALGRFGDAIRVVHLENGGPARARNAGIGQARGQYIAFLDADDIWLPGKLAAQVEHLEGDPEVGACYTGWHVWPALENGQFQAPQFASTPIVDPAVDAARSGWIYGRLLLTCELLTTTVMARAATLQRVGAFDESMPVGEDYDLWLRMSRTTRITRLDCIGALYRVLPGSESRRPRERNFEFEVVSATLARHGLVGPEGRAVCGAAVRRRLDRLVFQHGYLHLQSGSPSIALDAFSSLARRRPWQLKLWIHAARAWVQQARRGDACAVAGAASR
jgi:glycosyltransferase involved in cell wall biosynthesis